MEKRSRIVLLSVICLVLITAAAIALDMQVWRGHKAEDIRVFQRATGGLGMGAIATPIWNLLDYDPRIFSVEDCITWPVPGGYSYGPDRSATVSFFREITKDQWIVLEP
ncbi:MAG: hypothetical protein ACFE8Z_11585 [Candidatus Hermodarchaeota archaeon]